MHNLKGKALNLGFCIVLALGGMTAAWKKASTNIGIDFYQYWVVNQLLNRTPVPNLYAANDNVQFGAEFLEKAKKSGAPRQLAAAEFNARLQTISTPFLCGCMRAFGAGDYETDLSIYTLFMLLCFAGAVMVFSRCMDYSWPATLVFVGYLCAWFEPFASELRVGNVDSLQLAALAAYLWITTEMRWRQRDWVARFVVGLFITFKPNLVFVPCLLAFVWILLGQTRRLFMQMGGALVAGLFAFCFGCAAFHSVHCWTDWIAALVSLPNERISLEAGNMAPAQLLSQKLGIKVPMLTAIFFVLPVLAAVWWRCRSGPARWGEQDAVRSAFALGCLLAVLAPTLAWEHYYVLTVPALLLATRPRMGEGEGSLMRPFFATLALLFLSMLPIYPLMSVSLTAIPLMVASGSVILIILIAASRPVNEATGRQLEGFSG